MSDQSSEQEYAAFLRAEMDALHDLYVESGNPLFAWSAIQTHLRLLSDMRTGSTEVHEDKQSATDCVLPDWILEYLGQAASNLKSLVIGLDIRADNDPDADREDKVILPEITPAQRVEQSAFALGLEGDGWNAFRDSETRRWGARLRRLYDESRENGASAREAMDVVMEEHGTSDERTARRAMAGRARKTRGTKTRIAAPGPKHWSQWPLLPPVRGK